MSEFVSFVRKYNKNAADHIQKMENIIGVYPNGAIVEGRKFLEVILNEVVKIEEVHHLKYSTLNEKIKYLIMEGYINRDIQRKLDNIRILGNHAAHPSKIDEEKEAFKIHKETYEVAIWYYWTYYPYDLKVPSYYAPEIKNDVNGHDDTDLNEETLKANETLLLKEIDRLKDSSKEAVVNPSEFNSFKDYLHVDRHVQRDLEYILESKRGSSGNLILLCGNVGDGKSHLLSYLKGKKPDLISTYEIYNDATESSAPDMDAMQTLSKYLSDFSDERIKNANTNIILAINMGILHNFANHQDEDYTYNEFKTFVNKSGLFNSKLNTNYRHDNFSAISFSDYHEFELNENGPTSQFYTELMNKICNESSNNPIHQAYMRDKEKGRNSLLHMNYDLLRNSEVQSKIVEIIIQTIVEKKIRISARTYLNFIADILLNESEYEDITKITNTIGLEKLELLLPNMLFERVERSQLLSMIKEFDPLNSRSKHLDEILIKLNTSNDLQEIIDEYITHPDLRDLFSSFFTGTTDLVGKSWDIFIKTFIRGIFLTNISDIFFKDNYYNSYMIDLYHYNKLENKGHIKKIYNDISNAIFQWNGSPKKDYIYFEKTSEKYKIAQKLSVTPEINHIEPMKGEQLIKFKPTILLAYRDEDKKKQEIYLDIDLSLYRLLSDVLNGYRPSKTDMDEAVNFVDFIEQLMEFGEKNKEILIHNIEGNQLFTLEEDVFNSIVFEKE